MSESPPVIPIAVIAKETLPEGARTQLSMPPTTTVAEDQVHAGQRRVNLIWETTQATIAVAIVGAFIVLAIKGAASDTLTNALFLIVGFYFSRTNHSQIGGVGIKTTDQQSYAGR